MRSIVVIILQTLLVQALAKDAQVSMDTVVDKLLDKLIDRVSGAHADLDQTVLAKPGLANPVMTGPSLACKPAPAVQAVQMKMRMAGVPSSPLETFALTSIGATRDMSLKAQIKPAFQCMDRITKTKMIVMAEEVEKKVE